MTEKQFRIKLSDLIGDRVKIGSHKRGLSAFAAEHGCSFTTARRMYEGTYNSLSAICAVLESMGYEIEIVKKRERNEHK